MIEPKSDWEIFDEVLQEKGFPRELVIYPERFQDQASVAKRKAAILEMNKRGVSANSLTSLTPFTRQGIWKILKTRENNFASAVTPSSHL